MGGKEQRLTARIDKDRVGAVDWTFNCSKSVSTAEQVAGDSRIADVRTKAELKAMKLLEKQARTRVRKGAEIAKGKPKTWKFPARYTDNILYEAYRHPAARDGSPHSHTHYKIYNLTYDGVEKQWKALELRYVDRKAINECYRKALIKGLNQLGYKTTRVGQEFEITGFPAEVKAKFSERHNQIEALQESMEAKTGKPMGSKARQKLSVYDRPEKPDDMPLPDRRVKWLSQLTDGQVKAVQGIVAKARKAVQCLKWRHKLKRHLSLFKTEERPRETPVKEISRGR